MSLVQVIIDLLEGLTNFLMSLLVGFFTHFWAIVAVGVALLVGMMVWATITDQRSSYRVPVLLWYVVTVVYGYFVWQSADSWRILLVLVRCAFPAIVSMLIGLFCDSLSDRPLLTSIVGGIAYALVAVGTTIYRTLLIGILLSVGVLLVGGVVLWIVTSIYADNSKEMNDSFGKSANNARVRELYKKGYRPDGYSQEEVKRVMREKHELRD